MKIHHYGKSWFANRWRTWRRWWRHPERGLARRQFRRGIRFWWRTPWNMVFALAVLWAVLFQVYAGRIAPATLSRMMLYVYEFSSLLPALLVMIAWVSCLQDEGLNYFRGRRLCELLMTPSGARRYFPSLLVAPIVSWAFVRLVQYCIAFVFDAIQLYHRHQPRLGQHLFQWFDPILAGRVMMMVFWTMVPFASSLAMVCAMTALLAAWTIGNERSVAVAKSIAGVIGASIGLQIVQIVTIRTALIFNKAFGIRWMYFYALFYCVCTLAVCWIIWRASIRYLHGPRTIAKLQKAMESAK